MAFAISLHGARYAVMRINSNMSDPANFRSHPVTTSGIEWLPECSQDPASAASGIEYAALCRTDRFEDAALQRSGRCV